MKTTNVLKEGIPLYVWLWNAMNGEETVVTGSECFTFSFPGLSSVGVFSPAAESFDIDW